MVALGAGIVAIAALGVHLAKFDDALTLGDALVAGGTLALAAGTLWLGLQTRRDVDVSSDSIQLAREGIDAQDMPFVIPAVNPDQSRSLDLTTNGLRMWWEIGPEGDYWLQTRLWNIGKGPAITGDVTLEVDGRKILAARTGGIGEIVIQPGMAADIALPVSEDWPRLEARGVMRVYYRHINGTLYMTNSLALVSDTGVQPSNFNRLTSDRQDRPVV